MAVTTGQVTAEQLERMPTPDQHVELVRGEIVAMPPAGFEHGTIAGDIFAVLHSFVREHKLGKVTAAETGFVLTHDPDTVRAPDAAFVTAERLVQQTRAEGFFDGAPDLAVEVVSPGDADEEVEEKVLDYLEAGTRLVWVIRPRTRTITAYRSRTDIRLLKVGDSLEGVDVLPGFSLELKDLFA